ncbi:hypothetical protein FACS1894130_05290 [Spirochaetia bacterium]|nr:hypothetical protein FACS1894130_05290 [Spirochaetia bacterium]
MTPEGRIKADCLRYLERRGIFCWNNPTGAVRVAPDRWLHFGKKGSADLLGCLPGGRFLAVEVKAPGGRLSPEQRQFLDDVKTLGGLCLVVKGWKEIDSALREAGYISDGPLFSSEGNSAGQGIHIFSEEAQCKKKPTS